MIKEIPLDQIHESKSNPRKIFRAMDELEASVRQHGVLQPVLVRPNDKGYELVFGARRYRAAVAVELGAIPANVREMTDLEVLEAQVVENQQREDPHPLEESDGYRRLHEEHGKTVDEIAARVGKSRAYVYARLKLCALGEDARELFLKDELNPSVALYLARIPDAKLQAKATREVVKGYANQPMPAREAAHHIQRNYMLRLETAPFDIASASLLPKAGACSACPKRTGNQRELFAEVESADLCTDPTCFREKLDAEWDRRADAAQERGDLVLSAKKAKDLFEHGDSLKWNSDYIDLAKPHYDDPKHRSYRQLLGDTPPPLTLVRDPNGGIHELLPKKEINKALKDAGFKAPGRGSPSSPSSGSSGSSSKLSAKQKAERAEMREAEKKRQAAEELRERTWSKVVDAIVAGVEKRPVDRGFYLTIIRKGVLEAVYGDEGCQAVMERRGWENFGGKAVAERLEKLSEAELRGFLFESSVLADLSFDYRRGELKEVKRLCELYKVDLKAIEKAVAAEPPPRERACTVCGCTESKACAGGCSWTSPDVDVCSRCAPDLTEQKAAAEQGTLADDPALRVACPDCKAKPGEGCHTPGLKEPRDPHRSRRRDEAALPDSKALQVVCPACRVGLGEYCRRPAGEKAESLHNARQDAAAKTALKAAAGA